MTSPTHIFFAEFCLAFASIGQGIELNTANAIAAGLGSLAPDIDNSNSWLGRILPFISKPIERKFGHRTLFHSIFAILFLVAVVITSKALDILNQKSFEVLLAFSIGYTSHILIDCSSIQGVKILYPLSMKNAVFPLDTQQPEAYRIRVGSNADIALGFIFLLLTIPFAYISHKTHAKIIREIQKDINSAVRTYNELAKDFLCIANIYEGINTTTHEHIKGKFLIISAEKQNMLLVKNGILTLSVGKDNFKNDIYTANILTTPLARAKTEIKTLSIQNQSLSSIIDLNDTLTFITGEIEFYEAITSQQPPPTKFEFFKQTSETKIKLANATAEFLKSIDIADKIIKNAKITIKKIYPEQNKTIETEKTAKAPAQSFQLIEINDYENLRFAVSPGDTIREGQMIAFIQTIEIEKHKIEIENLSNQIEALAVELKTAEAKFRADTAQLKIKLKQIEDEISHRHELARRELAPQGEPGELINQKEKIRAEINKAIAEFELKKSKLELKQKQLQNRIKEIQLKINSLEAKRTITATAPGVIKEIKQSKIKNKKQFLLTLEPLNF